MGSLTIVAIAIANATAAAASTPLWVTILVGVVGGVATLLVALGGAVGRDRARRRETHAAAVKAVIAWNELPYQIRRRLTDEPEEIARLRDMAHDLQQDLVYYQTLLTGENAGLGAAYAIAARSIKAGAEPFIKEAWAGDPVGGPGGQVILGWGPGDPNGELQVFLAELPYRFGWRRLMPRKTHHI